MATLFTAFKLRGVEFKNRIFVSPMCQYCSRDGLPGDWHLVHLGSRAVGGAALVMVEASAVTQVGALRRAESVVLGGADGPGASRVGRGLHAVEIAPERVSRVVDAQRRVVPFAVKLCPNVGMSRIPTTIIDEELDLIFNSMTFYHIRGVAFAQPWIILSCADILRVHPDRKRDLLSEIKEWIIAEVNVIIHTV